MAPAPRGLSIRIHLEKTCLTLEIVMGVPIRLRIGNASGSYPPLCGGHLARSGLSPTVPVRSAFPWLKTLSSAGIERSSQPATQQQFRISSEDFRIQPLWLLWMARRRRILLAFFKNLRTGLDRSKSSSIPQVSAASRPLGDGGTLPCEGRCRGGISRGRSPRRGPLRVGS